MKLFNTCILLTASNFALLSATPTTILVKNDTNQAIVLEVNIEYSLMRGISGTRATSLLSREIEANSEINVIDWLISPELRSGRTLSIQNLAVKINNMPVNLGDFSAIRVLAFKDGDNTSIRVERLSAFFASRLATTYWWAGVKTSWTSFWKNLFGYKRKYRGETPRNFQRCAYYLWQVGCRFLMPYQLEYLSKMKPKKCK